MQQQKAGFPVLANTNNPVSETFERLIYVNNTGPQVSHSGGHKQPENSRVALHRPLDAWAKQLSQKLASSATARDHLKSTAATKTQRADGANERARNSNRFLLSFLQTLSDAQNIAPFFAISLSLQLKGGGSGAAATQRERGASLACVS